MVDDERLVEAVDGTGCSYQLFIAFILTIQYLTREASGGTGASARIRSAFIDNGEPMGCRATYN